MNPAWYVIGNSPVFIIWYAIDILYQKEIKGAE
jgi:hypothetical protein